MRLLLFHPEWTRSCEACQKYLFNDSEGGDHDVTRRPAKIGLPVLRPPGVRTPCFKCPKIPAEQPVKMAHFAIDMTAQNILAYQFHRRCAAVQRWPDDPIVVRNAGIIKDVEDAHARMPMLELIAVISSRKTK